MKNWLFGVLLIALVSLGSNACAQELDDDYKVQGEYAGTLEMGEEKLKFGLQVIARGKGTFSGVGYHGGLPGDGWDKEGPSRTDDVKAEEGKVTFKSDEGIAVVENGQAKIFTPDGTEIGTLKRIERKSPTLGKEPPQNAIVLFDGSSVDNWEYRGKPARMTEDGLLMQGAASKQRFGSHHLHVEFLLPYKPNDRGQKRGNSGIYLQGRYEVQMLDSFGLSGENNECGGIYSIKKPDQNMCFPPMQWQTYDIDFHQAKFENGKKIRNAWMTVRHNGVVIHDHVELPKKTTAAPLNEGQEPGFVFLQDHGNPVRYRNIWVEPLQQTAEKETLEGDNDVSYWLGLPKGYGFSEKKWPLLLFLHGSGERGNNLEKVKVHGPPKLLRMGQQIPAIVVSPQCKSGQRWNAEELSGLLDKIESKYVVDKDRIYVTGLSMGGYGTWALAAHSPERFAAIAPVCGGGTKEMAKSIGSKIPTWVFHGDNDRVVPLSKSKVLVDEMKAMGVDVKFTIYPGVGHDSWTATYDDPELWKWMMSQKK